MDNSKFQYSDYSNSSVATAVESLLLIEHNGSLNKIRAISSSLVILANAFPDEARNINKVLALPKAAVPKNIVKVVFKPSNLTTEANVNADCPTCGDNLKDKKINTLDDVLAMGDKAFLLGVAKNMGIKTHPSMKVDTIAQKILIGTPDHDEEEEVTTNKDAENNG